MAENIKVFAPVIIPTLCRYDHFKQCIESLSKCTFANQTEVYVGLDYPAKDEHWDGYKKIKSYLASVGNMGFKNLTIIERERNYGFGPTGNFRMLVNFILSKYDRFIATEDDNVFSPNFLEFINKGLEKFKDDQKILAICGYCHPYKIKHGDNNYFMQNVDFSAWGYGIWKDRYDAFCNNVNHKYFYKKVCNPYNGYLLYRQGFNRLRDFFLYLTRKNFIPVNDDVLSIYMAMEKMNVVMPTTTKVRNEGWDGTGRNCNTKDTKLIQLHSNRIIDKNIHFEFIGNGKAYYNANRKIFREQSYAKISFKNFITTIFRICFNKALVLLHIQNRQ